MQTCKQLIEMSKPIDKIELALTLFCFASQLALQTDRKRAPPEDRAPLVWVSSPEGGGD